MKTTAKTHEMDGGIEKQYEFYDEKDKFRAYSFANYLCDKHGFVTFEDNDKLYYYKNGFYQPCGKVVIREELVDELRDDFTNRKLSKVLEIVKGKTTIKRRDFGEDPRYINVNNGIYDIEEERLLEHGPDKMFLSKIPVDFRKDADCPKIKEFVKDVVDDSNFELIQELFGYCLYRGYDLNKAFMFLGEGSNGKTTLINLLAEFLGEENVESQSLHDILTDSYAKAKLHRRLVNVDADISNEVLKDTSNFKKLTGEDPVSARHPYGKGFKFRNHAKLVFSANDLPRTRDDSMGFFRRWILIDFPYTFTEKEDDGCKDIEKDILERLTDPEEMSGLLNWAIEGLKRILEEESFSTKGSADHTKERWIMKSDTLAAFIESRVEVHVGSELPTDDFFEYYSRFCQERDVTPHDAATVGKRLQKLVPKAKKRRKRIDGDRVAHYLNIKVESEAGVKEDVKSAIMRLQDDDGLGVSYGDLFEEIEGYEEDEVKSVVDGMLENGVAFETKPNRVRLT